uniref:Myb-like DNA-binding domain containing protein n=1 Tax=Coptotermes formosanus TaxID=36987 RepID=R4UK16_COPFO|nr:Myb-like DNA-binding domain containing protein [Coptotermes formosanus]
MGIQTQYKMALSSSSSITRSIKPERKQRTIFTKEEDQAIMNFVQAFGANHGERIEPFIKTRTSRQCRERWKNFLSPDVSKKGWTVEEDLLLEKLVNEFGPKWSNLAKFFPGRTDVLIKNRYCLLLRHIRAGKRASTVSNKRFEQNQPIFSVESEVEGTWKENEVDAGSEFQLNSFNSVEGDDSFHFDCFLE